MPRRREVPKRDILPDPKFGSVDLSKFVNVRRNADIAIALDGSLAGHLIYLPYLNQTAMTPCFTKRQGGGQKRKSRRRPDETRCHLETEMRERLVGFCHTVNFFTLFHRCTAPF